MSQYVRWFSEIGIEDVPEIGGKNASLGELLRTLAPEGIRVPAGFALTADATDLSDLGNAAIPFACAAGGIGGLGRIVHVARPRSSPPGWARGLREQLRTLIPNESAARCQPSEVGVLVDRDIERAICDEADKFGAEVDCLSSHGRGVSRALHGSVAKAVLQRIHRPVLVTRRPEE